MQKLLDERQPVSPPHSHTKSVKIESTIKIGKRTRDSWINYDQARALGIIANLWGKEWNEKTGDYSSLGVRQFRGFILDLRLALRGNIDSLNFQPNGNSMNGQQAGLWIGHDGLFWVKVYDTLTMFPEQDVNSPIMQSLRKLAEEKIVRGEIKRSYADAIAKNNPHLQRLLSGNAEAPLHHSVSSLTFTSSRPALATAAGASPKRSIELHQIQKAYETWTQNPSSRQEAAQNLLTIIQEYLNQQNSGLHIERHEILDLLRAQEVNFQNYNIKGLAEVAQLLSHSGTSRQIEVERLGQDLFPAKSPSRQAKSNALKRKPKR